MITIERKRHSPIPIIFSETSNHLDEYFSCKKITIKINKQNITVRNENPFM
jgi:hypothetical protein